MTMKWLNKDELYSWMPCTDEEAQEFAKTYPEQFAQVPKELAEVLQVAFETYMVANAAINEWLDKIKALES